MKKYLAAVGAMTALGSIANVAYAADSKDDSLTWFGVTLYGTVDVGYTYMNRGAPINDYFPATLPYMVQTFGHKQISTISGNAMSQSKLGLKGDIPIMDDWSAVFKLETGFNPTSGQLSDGPKSIIQQNGVPLANRTANGDSSRAGQPFQGGAYGGVSSKTFGTLTVGRQNSLLGDAVAKYDPLGASYAFSFVGYSGTSGGAGDTQDFRWDNSVKYTNQIGMFRVAGMFGNGSNGAGNGIGGAVGADPLPGWSIDATYQNRKDEIAGAALASIAACTATAAANTNACLPAGLSANSTLAATVSDNWAWELATSYLLGSVKFSGAYEDIHFRNPQTPLGAPLTGQIGGVLVANDIGGYQILTNNKAYDQNNKILQYMWAGARWSVTPHLDVFGAWYYILQNQYLKGGTVRCSGGNFNTATSTTAGHVTESTQCSGREAGYSLVADYKFNKHFDVYAGAMYSHLADGLAAGSLTTFNIDPTIGGRFNF